MSPFQKSLIIAVISFVIGLLIKPWYCIPFGLAGFIVGVFVSTKLDSKMHMKRAIEKNDEEESALKKVIDRLPAYLQLLPISDANEIDHKIRQWDAANKAVMEHSYGPGHDTYFEYNICNLDGIQQLMADEIKISFRKRHDPECLGWNSLTKMIGDGRSSCLYRWGANQFGMEIFRRQSEEYVFAKLSKYTL